MKKLTTKELIETMAKEIGRLQKLCKDNGIDYLPPNTNPGASMSVKAEVKVFKSPEEANEYRESLNKS